MRRPYRRQSPGGLFSSLLLLGTLLCPIGPCLQSWADDSTPPPSMESTVDRVLSVYKALPKGMTLEGTGLGLPPLTGPSYERLGNRLVFAGGEVYNLPVSAEEVLTIISALEHDPRLGVSLTLSNRLIAYGRLNSRSKVARNLLKGDRLVCGVAFARSKWFKDTRLPGGYVPKAVIGRRKIMAVIHTNLDEFWFKLEKKKAGGGKTIQSTGFRTTYLIIPISRTRARDGGYLPDRERMARNEIEEADKANLDHLNSTREAYFKIPVLKTAGHYGEVAALIRYLLKRGVNLKPLKAKLKE